MPPFLEIRRGQGGRNRYCHLTQRQLGTTLETRIDCKPPISGSCVSTQLQAQSLPNTGQVLTQMDLRQRAGKETVTYTFQNISLFPTHNSPIGVLLDSRWLSRVIQGSRIPHQVAPTLPLHSVVGWVRRVRNRHGRCGEGAGWEGRHAFTHIPYDQLNCKETRK